MDALLIGLSVVLAFVGMALFVGPAVAYGWRTSGWRERAALVLLVVALALMLIGSALA